MKSTTRKNAGKRVANRPRAEFSDPAVEAVFSAYPRPLQSKLLALRRLIFDTAKATKGVGALQETLKWGSRAISRPRRRAAARSGSTATNPLPTDTRSISIATPIWSERSASSIRPN
jgi:hypothetical protein